MRVVYFLLITIGLAACAEEQKSADSQVAKNDSEITALTEENARLKEHIEFQEYRIHQTGGPELLLLHAEYHAMRGEHTIAQEKIDMIKEVHGESEHAAKATDIEARMQQEETKPIDPPDPNDQIEIEKDEVHGITWYYDRRVPRDPDTTSFYIYMGHKVTGAPWLRMRANYAGDHWLYLKEVILKNSALEWRMGPDPRLIFTTAGDLFCAEWNDAPPTFEEIRMIKDLIAGGDIEMTFIGDRDKFTRNISENEIQGLLNILDLYSSMVRLEELEAGV